MRTSGKLVAAVHEELANATPIRRRRRRCRRHSDTRSSCRLHEGEFHTACTGRVRFSSDDLALRLRPLLFNGVAEIRHGLTEFPAGLAEPFLDRALGALNGALMFHFLVAGEDPDGLLDLSLSLLHFTMGFLLFHDITLY